MNYHIYLSKKKTNAQGFAPIYSKITIDKKIYERSSGLFILTQNWNKVYKRVKPNIADATNMNIEINNFEAKLHLLKQNNASIIEVDMALNLSQNNKPKTVTINEIITTYLKKQELLVGVADGITYNTYKTYKCKVYNLTNFLKTIDKPNMLITDFNYSYGVLYKQYLYLKLFSTGHINKCIKFVKTMMHFAQYEYGYAPTNLMLLKLKEIKGKPIIYLTESELKAVQEHVYLNQLHQKTADLFLLQCFTGMAYADVMKLNTNILIEHNGNSFINYERLKTGVRGLVPVLPQVQKILSRYDGKCPQLCNAVYNRILKEIAQVCAISKNITSHVGRKTFACMLVSKGASMEATTKMLAKTNTRETERIYAELQYDRVFSEMPNFG